MICLWSRLGAWVPSVQKHHSSTLQEQIENSYLEKVTEKKSIKNLKDEQNFIFTLCSALNSYGALKW